MKCEDAREALLEAEPGELEEEARSALGRHLEACARCRAEAERIADATRALRTRLDPVSPPDVERILTEAGVGPDEQGGLRLVGSGEGEEHRHGSRRARRLLIRVLPVAAAASVAAVLFIGSEGPEGPAPVTPLPPASGVAGAPAVEITPPPDRNAVVLETRNPDITVIWLYGEGP